MRKLMLRLFGANTTPPCYGNGYSHCGGGHRCDQCDAPVETRNSQCFRRVPRWSWLAAIGDVLSLTWLMPQPKILVRETPQKEKM